MHTFDRVGTMETPRMAIDTVKWNGEMHSVKGRHYKRGITMMRRLAKKLVLDVALFQQEVAN